MKNHLRKILSFILCLAMCLSLFPTAAFATEIDSDAGDGQTYVEPQEEPVVTDPVVETPEAQPVPEPDVTPEPTVEPTDEPTPEATSAPEDMPATPAPEATPEVTPEATPEVTPDAAEEEAEDEDVMPSDLVDDANTLAENTLRANLAAATAGSAVTLTESVTLTSDLTVPYEVILHINNGVTLTVPNGITLTNNYHIFLQQGSNLVVEGGGMLANVLVGPIHPCVYLYGGVLTVVGTITAATENSYVGVYESSYYTSLSAATNLTEDMLAYSGTITSGESLNTVLMENWSDYFLKISGTINVADYTTIYRTVSFFGGTVIVPSGVTFSNCGRLFLVDGCSLTIEKGGTFYGNTPECDETSSFTDNGNIAQVVTSWAEFKSAAENSRTISINIIGDVTLEEDVVVPMDIPVSITGGSLTIPSGKSLTVGARLSLGNISTGEGTVSSSLVIAEGATLTLKDPTNVGGWIPVASVYVSDGTVTNNGTINLQTSDGAAVSGRPAVELYGGEYTGDRSIVKVCYYGVEDAAEINTRLAEGYGYYVFITYTDKTIDVNMTIPAGVNVTIQADVSGTKATYTVAEGVTVTNNGTFTTNGDVVIENGGEWSGTAPTFTGEGKLIDNNSSTGADTTAEDTLRANLAAAASGDTVTLTESVTLTEDLTVPYGVTLEIDNGGTLIVPNGITLTNNYLVVLRTGGNLTVDEGGKFAHEYLEEIEEAVIPWLHLYGGVFTVKGEISTNRTEDVYYAIYHSNYYESLADATNLREDVLGYSGNPQSGEEIKTALEANYHHWEFGFSGSTISIVDGTTIPADKFAVFNGGTITIPNGVTFTNNSSVNMNNFTVIVEKGGTFINNGFVGLSAAVNIGSVSLPASTFTVEKGGTYVGGAPSCSGTSSFTDKNITAAEDTLRANLAAAASGDIVTLTENVTLTEDLTVPYGVRLDIGEGGTLTVPSGITLTNHYYILLETGDLTVEIGGKLANMMVVQESGGTAMPCIYLHGGVLTVNGEISTDSLNIFYASYNPAYYTSLADATNLNEEVVAYSESAASGEDIKNALAANYYYWSFTLPDAISIADGTTIPEGKLVVLNRGTITVPAGATFTNNGILSLYNGCTMVVEKGATYVGNEPDCDDTSIFTNNNSSTGADTTAEDTLRANLAAATAGSAVTMTESVKLTRDLTVPYGVTLVIEDGATLAVLSGVTLTNHYTISLQPGSYLAVNAGGKLAHVCEPQESGDTVTPCLYLYGGVLTVNGEISTDAAEARFATYDPSCYTSVTKATNLSADVLGYTGRVASGEEIKNAFETDFYNWRFILSDSINIVDGTTIPTNKKVDIGGGTVTVPAGVTFTNNGTLTLQNGCTFTVEAGGTYVGNEPICYGTSSFVDKNTNMAEDTLRANLAAAASGDTVTLTENVTLTEDLTVPYGVRLDIGEGGTLTVPSGITLTNNYLIHLMQGSNLVVAVGGKLVNMYDWQESGSTTGPCVNLNGGVLTVYGSASTDTAGAEMDTSAYVAGYFSRFYSSLYEATNLSADVVRYSGRPTSGEDIKTALGTNYYGWYFEISDSISIEDGTTIPTDKQVTFSGGTVTVPAGVTFTNNGTLTLQNGCTFTVEAGGTYVGNEPICYGTSSFTDKNITAAEDALREALAAAAETGGFVTVDKDVTLTSDLTVNAESGTLKLELAGGKLTIPTGVKLIIGNNAQLIFAGGTIEGEGTVALATGATAHLDADKYADVDFAAISGGKVDASNTEYFASFADEAELNRHLAATGFKSVSLVQADDTTVTLTADATIAEGTLVDVSDGSTLVVSNGALINNGTFQISGNGTFTVNSGAVFVNNGEYICDYYGIVNIGGAVSGANSGAIAVTARTVDELNAAINANVSSITVPTGTSINFENSFTIPEGVTLFVEGSAFLHFPAGANLVNCGTLEVVGNVNVYEGSGVENNGTINVTGGFVVHSGAQFNNNGTVNGEILKVTDTVSTEGELRYAINECDNIDVVGDITITGYFAVPEGKTVNIREGGKITVPSGLIIDIYDTINIFPGGKLDIKSGAAASIHTKSDGSFPAIELLGGTLTVNGDISTDAADVYYAVYDSACYTSLPNATNLSADVLGYRGVAASGNDIKTALETNYHHYDITISGLVRIIDGTTIPAGTTVQLLGDISTTIVVPSGVTLTNNGELKTAVNILVKEGGAIEGEVTCINGAKIYNANEQGISSYVTTESELRLAIAAGVDSISVGADITIDGDLTIPEGMHISIGNGNTLTVNGTFETYSGGNIGEQAELVVNDLRIMSVTIGERNSITLLSLDGGKLTVRGSYYTDAAWIPFTILVSADFYPCGVNELFATAINGNVDIDNVQLYMEIATEDDIRTAIDAGFGGYSFYSAEGITEITLTSDLTLTGKVREDGNIMSYQFYDCTIIVPDGVTLTIDENVGMALTHNAYSDSEEAPKLIIEKGGALVENGHLSLYNGATLVDQNDGYEFDGVVDTEEDLRYVIGAGYDTVNIEGDITITEDIDISSLLTIVSGGSLTVKKGVTVNLNDSISILTGGSMTVQSGAQVIYGEKQYDGWTRGVVIGLYGGKLVAPESSLVKDAFSTPPNKIYIDTTAYDNTNRYTSALNGVSKSSVAGNFEVTSAKDITTALNAGYKYNSIVFVPMEEGDISISGAVTIPADRNVSFCAKNSEVSDVAINFVSGSTLTNNGILNILSTVNICEGAKYVSGSKAILNHNDLMNFIGDTANACTHTWEMQSTEPATCDVDGVRTDYCMRCGSTRTVTIPATGHNYKTVAAEPATCIDDGTYEYRICVNDCGSVYVKGADGKWGEKQRVETEEAFNALITEPKSEEKHAYEVTAPTFYMDGAKVCSVCGSSIGVDEDITLKAAIYRDDWKIPVNININTAGAPEGAAVVGGSAKVLAAYNGGGLDLNALVSCDNVSDKDIVLAGWTVERSDGKVFFYEEGRLDGFYDADVYGISPTVVADMFTFDATSFYDIINETPTLGTDVPYTIDENGILRYESGEEYVSFTFSAVWVRNEKTLYFERWTTETDAINEDGSVNSAEKVAFPIAVPVDSITRGMSEPIFASEAELIRPTTNITGYTFSRWEVYLNWGDDYVGAVEVGTTINDLLAGRELQDSDELVLRAVYVPSSTVCVAGVEGCWQLYADGTLVVDSFDNEDYKAYASSVVNVKLADTIYLVPMSAFEGFTAMRSIGLENVSNIRAYAFADCKLLNGINLDAVMWMGESAFAGCKSLESVNLNNGITFIGKNAFKGSGIKSVNLELNTGYAVSDGVFMDCVNLEYARISVPTEAYTLPQSIFEGCTALTRVDISGFSGIGNRAFAGCTALTGVELYGVCVIYSYAFENCTKLANISFDEAMLGTIDADGNCNNLGEIEDNAFVGCNALKTVYLTGSAAQWTAMKNSGNIGSVGNDKLIKATVKAQKDVTSVTVNNAPKYVGVGGTRALTAKVAPADAFPADVVWVFCDENGEISYLEGDSPAVIYDAESLAQLNTVTGELTGLAEGTVYVMGIANGYQLGSTENDTRWVKSAVTQIEVRDYGMTGEDVIVLPDADNKADSRYWFEDYLADGGYAFALEGNDKAQLSANWNTSKDTKLVWSLDADDALYATISATGLLTAKNVTSTVNVTVHVTTADGQSPVASREITIYPLPVGLDLFLKNVTTDSGELAYNESAVNGKTVTLDIKDFMEGGKYADGLYLVAATGVKNSRPSYNIVAGDSASPILVYDENFAELTDDINVGGYPKGIVCRIMPVDADAAIGKSVKWTINLTNHSSKRVATQTVTFKFVDQVTALMSDADSYNIYSGQKLTLKAYACDESGNATKLDKNGKPVAMTNKEVTWSIVSGEAYASVTAAGQLTAKTVQDMQTVTARVALVENPDVYKDVEITIYPLVTNIDILRVTTDEGGNIATEKVNDAKLYIDLNNPEPLYFTARFTPEKSVWRENSFTIKQSSGKVVDVEMMENGEGVIVKAKESNVVGTETLTIASTDSGKVSAKLTVTTGYFVNGITIDGYEYNSDAGNWLDDSGNAPTVKVGSKLTLKALAWNDAAATESSKTGVSFALENAEDSAYATVSAAGVVTPKTIYGIRDVAIIATAKDVKATTTRIVVRIEPKEAGILTIENELEENITKGTQLMDIGTESEPEMVRLFAIDLERDEYGNKVYPKVTWKSSNSSIASVDPDSGVVVANKMGTATITATVTDAARPDDARTATVTIKVTRLVKEISLATDKNVDAVIASGKSLNIKATVAPTNASTKTVTWSIISGAEYATISTSGAVKANKGITEPQTIEIMATAKDGGGAYSTMLIDILPETTGISILSGGNNVENTTVTMYAHADAAMHDVLRLVAATYPEGASNNVTWTSSNKNVVTVDEYGVVTAVKSGTANITVKATDGTNKSASVKITVIQPIESIEIPREASLGAGKTLTFKAVISPTSVTNKNLVWSVRTLSGEMANCATISSSGALKANAVTSEHVVEVTVTAADGCGASASCLVVIKPLVTSVELYYGAEMVNGKQIDIIGGESLMISANNLPFVSTQGWTWKSSNEKIATVESTASGAVIKTTADGQAGTVTITATASDGSNKTANFKVKVTQLVTDITLNVEGGFILAAGKSITIKATTNTNASNKKVVWTFNDGSNQIDGVSISTSGVLKADATITEPTSVTVVCNSADGNYAVSVDANIYPAATKVTIFNDEDVTGKTLDLSTTDVIYLTADTEPYEASDAVTWKTSNASIATVVVEGNGNAVVTPTGTKTGTVTITATTADGTNKSANVKVRVYVPVSEITITPPAAMQIERGYAHIAAGKSMTLKATTNSDATTKKVTWSVDCDDTVATINANGVLATKATAAGEVVQVTATATDGSETCATYSVQITEPVTKLYIRYAIGEDDLTGTTINLPTDESVEIASYAQLGESEGYEWSKWKTSNANIATVDVEGTQVWITPTGTKTGTVTITATTMDGTNKSATVKVNVYTPVENINIYAPNMVGDIATIGTGKSMTLKADVTGRGGLTPTNKAVTWSVVDGEEYISVNASSGALSIKSAAMKTVETDWVEATVKATAKDIIGVESNWLTVRVYKTLAQKVTVEKAAGELSTTLDVGEAISLVATAYSDTKGTIVLDEAPIVWTSSNESIATVDEYGDVTALSSGYVTITATSADGNNKSGSIALTVVK